MFTDVRFQHIERNVFSAGGCQSTLDGSADVCCGVNQGAVDVEQINRERRKSRRQRRLSIRQPGTRLPPSGRITSCFPSGLRGSCRG